MQDRMLCQEKTKISRIVFAAILGLLAAGSGAAPVSAQLVDAKPRKRVARGAGENPVRTAIEPSIAFNPKAPITTNPFLDRKDQFTVIFSVQKIPTGGALEDPWYLDYAVGDFYDFDSSAGEDWDILWAETFAVQVPSPNNDVATDGSVTLVEGFNGGQTRRFTGASVVDPLGTPEGFTVDSEIDVQQDKLVFMPGVHFAGELEVRYTRIGAHPMFFGDDLVYIAARSEELATQGQVHFEASADGGVTWNSGWSNVPTAGGPDPLAIGYPSRPVIDTNGDSLHIAYADQLGEHIRAAIAGDVDTSPQFIHNNLDINPLLLKNPGPGETWFTESKKWLAGDFALGPFVNMGTLGSDTAYVVYHDIDAPDVAGDADFDVYIVRGSRTSQDPNMVWGTPMRITDDGLNVLSDQFMPVIVVDDVNFKVHVAWYDTVRDPQQPGQPVKIGLYYRRASETGRGLTWDMLPVLLDPIAIDTTKVDNGAYFGDHIDITLVDQGGSPNDNEFVVVTYVGTMRSGAIGFAPDPSSTNENIYSVVIEQLQN